MHSAGTTVGACCFSFLFLVPSYYLARFLISQASSTFPRKIESKQSAPSPLYPPLRASPQSTISNPSPIPTSCLPSTNRTAHPTLSSNILTNHPPLLEGQWDAVMRVMGQAHMHLHMQGVVRIQTDIRVGTRCVVSFSPLLIKMFWRSKPPGSWAALYTC